ncbi:MAG: hypothetical protein R2879_22515, partial [Saprospiraceae bacterium]
MKSQFLYLNLLFLLSVISLHLPIWNNGKFASLLSIIYTILSDNLGLENLTTISIVIFLTPIYFFYFFIFKTVDINWIKIFILIILLFSIFP